MATLTEDETTGTTPLHRRHPGPADAAAAVIPARTAPARAGTARIDPADARALSRTLFARLESLEEGTPEHSYVRNTLVELNLTLVHYAAARAGARKQSYEDVVQVGTIGLIKAINRFDLQRGVEFPSFALPTVIGEIKRYFRDTTWALHVPRRLRDLRVELTEAERHLEQTHGRNPTVSELARHLHLEDEEVIEGLIAANGYSAASLDTAEDADGLDESLAHHIGYADRELAKTEDLQALKPLIAALPEHERRVLALRYTADLTQSAIAEELGVSQTQVSRLLKRAVVRLRRQLGDGLGA
ncbi:SigB/SigF/SigG family RNA polymerase sigma factor [Streptomyces seoulensis]